MTRRRRAAALSSVVALGLSACGRVPSAPSPPAPPAGTIVAAPPPPAAPSALAEASPQEPPTPLPPWIGRVEDPACSWSTERWSRRTITLLRLRPDGPVFARVVGGKARMHIPVGAAGHGTLDVGSNGLVISGFVARAHAPLFAASDFAMNGVLYPRSTTPLSWREGFSDGVSVTMEAPKGIVVKDPPLTARRPCADLTLDSGATLAPARAAFGKEHGASHMLRAGTIEVFSDPARPADITLVLPERAYVASFASSGAFSRILLQRDQVFVAGWVRTSNLVEDWSGGGGTMSGIGGVGIGSGHFRSTRKVICAADVPVVAEAAGERATVGHVLSGAPIDVADEPGGFARVRVANRFIHAADASSFLVRTADLKGCRTLGP